MKKHIILSTLSLYALSTHGSFASSEEQVVAKIDRKNFQRTLALKTDEGEALHPVPGYVQDSNEKLLADAEKLPKFISAEIRYNMNVSPDVTAIEMDGRYELDQDMVQAIVTYYPGLTSLEYAHIVKVNSLSPLAKLAQLQKLVIRGEHDAPLEDLGKILSLTDLTLSQMESVKVPPSIANLASLASLELSDVGLRTVPPFLEGLRLNRLVLSKNKNLNFSGAPKLPTVEILEVRSMNLRSFSFVRKFVPNVQTLDISNNAHHGVGYAGLPIEAKDFAKLRSLTALYTSGNKHDGSQLQILAEALPNLRELKIAGNCGVKTKFDPMVLGDFEQLEVLDVSHCDLTDISFLNRMDQLKVLSLSCNGIRGKKLSLLNMPQMDHLTSLDVSVLEIENLNDIPLKYFPKLQHLDISENYASDQHGENERPIKLDENSFSRVAKTLTSLDLSLKSISAKQFETLRVLIHLNELTLKQSTFDKLGWPQALHKLPLKKMILLGAGSFKRSLVGEELQKLLKG